MPDEPLPHPDPPSHGFVKMMRTPDILELIEEAPQAFTLASVIALRARFKPGVSLKGLHPGEAFLGDYSVCGMSEQQYRTAKTKLLKWGFATFRATNKGTVARLIDKRLFDVLSAATNGQPTDGATDKQRLTKNVKNVQEGKEGRKGCAKAHHLLSENDSFEQPTEAELYAFAEASNLDANFAAAFFDQHQRGGWQIANKLTGKAEPIRDWRKALVAFCEKLENDRAGV